MGKTIMHVVGARPNFMKLAPVFNSICKSEKIEQIVIHTGQHYNHNMSDIFFKELNIPNPDENLEINGGSVLEQIGNGIIMMEKVMLKYKPDLLFVYGDINATACSTIVASKLGVKIAHVEAGLRSFDKAMPEETNRLIADTLSDYYFTPSEDANVNLLKEGRKVENIFLVGNVMIDTLVRFLPKAKTAKFDFDIPDKYVLVTLHRPSNVDDQDNLISIMKYLNDFCDGFKIIFPLHPRTRSKIPVGMIEELKYIVFIEPLGYLQFINLQLNAYFIITDSGGVQEESTYLGTPCFTLRDNTERPITIDQGTNILVGSDIKKLKKAVDNYFLEKNQVKKIPKFWDGHAADRISLIVNNLLFVE